MAHRPDNPASADGPVRTCIGCRQRAAKRELLRLVVGRDADGDVVVADPDGTAPGRGAHLHPTAACLDLAKRRRAFARALRHDAGVRGALRLDGVEELLATAPPYDRTDDPDRPHPAKNGSTSS